MSADDEKPIIGPYLFWRVYQMPIILGVLSFLFVAISVLIFAKSYQQVTPIVFSSEAPDVAGESTRSATSAQILVDVEGAVVRPGVYRLPKGSRVDDAIVAAGGYSRLVDGAMVAKILNRAAKLADGSKLYIPEKGSVPSGSGQSSLPKRSDVNSFVGVVNINVATQSELEALSGVGPVTAGKIISGRPYARIEELVEKKAMSQGLYTKLKDKMAL